MSDPLSAQAEILKLKSKKKFKLKHYYMSFQLYNVEYAIDIDYVHEIRPYLETEILPIYAPSFIVGMIYLNEMLIPIYDLGIFSDDQALDLEKHNQIILLLELGAEAVGFLVDSLKGIVEINIDKLLLPREEGGDASFFSRFISNRVIIDGRDVFVLDLEKLFIENKYFSEYSNKATLYHG